MFSPDREQSAVQSTTIVILALHTTQVAARHLIIAENESIATKLQHELHDNFIM